MIDNKYQKRWAKPEVPAELEMTEVIERESAVERESVVIEKELRALTKPEEVVVKKKVLGHKYFVTYTGPHLRLSISPGIGQVEKGKEYLVSEELYNSLKGLKGWSVRVEEVIE